MAKILTLHDIIAFFDLNLNLKCNHSVKRGGSQKWRTLRQAQGDITRRIAGLSW